MSQITDYTFHTKYYANIPDNGMMPIKFSDDDDSQRLIINL